MADRASGGVEACPNNCLCFGVTDAFCIVPINRKYYSEVIAIVPIIGYNISQSEV